VSVTYPTGMSLLSTSAVNVNEKTLRQGPCAQMQPAYNACACCVLPNSALKTRLQKRKGGPLWNYKHRGWSCLSTCKAELVRGHEAEPLRSHMNNQHRQQLTQHGSCFKQRQDSPQAPKSFPNPPAGNWFQSACVSSIQDTESKNSKLLALARPCGN
jgi:hypothetical protein